MIILFILFVITIVFYIHNVRAFDYWKKRGVKHEKPQLLFGTAKDIYLLKRSITQIATELYFKYPNEKVVGAFRSTSPGLIIRDPELIKRVLITDFFYFHKRGILPGESLEPLLQNLFLGEGDLWRLLRQRITPAFTSGKLKAMFPLIVERAEHLQIRTLAAARQNRPIDARDLMARYTTDFIGACGFGLNADSLNEEDSAFRKLGDEIFRLDFKQCITVFLKDNFPALAKNLKLLGRIENQIIHLVNFVLKERNYEPSGRNDFIDLLLECKNKGIMIGESIEKFNKDGTPCEAKMELSDILIAAQAFTFFGAGFETSSSATSFTLHQLAYHPDVQKKVQQEIDSVLAKYNNKLSFDAIKDMTYLEWTLKEGMRIFPSLGYLLRTCVKKYTFPETNVTIDEGVGVCIPVQALHLDPKYWNKPDEFRPERFHPDEFKDITKSIYLPFGDGPRACIGERMGLMQSLAGLAAVLSRFTVEPAPQSKRYPIVLSRVDIVQSIEGGLPLIFRERKF